MDPIEVVVAGHICLDIIPELHGPVIFEPGRLVEAGPATLMTGGAVSNTGQALHKLGVKVHLVGKVGQGLFARAIQEILERAGEGLSGGLVETDAAPTSYSIVVNLSGQDRMFLHAPGCNGIFQSSDVSDEVLAAAKVFHFGYPPLMERMFADGGAELVDLFRRAKSHGCTTSLDMSLPDANAASGHADWYAILARVLPYVDLFIPSIEEAMFMLERTTFDAIRGSRYSRLPDSLFRKLANEASQLGAKMVGIKAGDRGIYLCTPTTLDGFGRGAPSDPDTWTGKELWAPCFEVHVQGTTGAGDATIAGFLMGMRRGMSATEALRAAVAAGASCCEQSDAVSGVQSWTDTARRIACGWPSRTAELDSKWELVEGVFKRG